MDQFNNQNAFWPSTRQRQKPNGWTLSLGMVHSIYIKTVATVCNRYKSGDKKTVRSRVEESPSLLPVLITELSMLVEPKSKQTLLYYNSMV